jgi:hypothetical protein
VIDMLPILGLGFVIGLQHAMEADHLAAVAALASRHGRAGDIVRHGLTWGLGHTLTLLALGGAAFVLGGAIPDALARALELAVGVMLVLLGGQLLFRLFRGGVHLHVHRHEDAGPHLHLHSHARTEEDGPPGALQQAQPARHALHQQHALHAHEGEGFRWRTLFVGLMHGMAGSAALLLLALAQVRDPLRGVAFILVFGLGSMVGMAALSAVLAVPLSLSSRFLGWANRGLQLVIGCCTVGVGIATMIAHAR